MPTVNLKDAKAGFSSLVDGAIRGEFVTITRHGKAVAALVRVEAAESRERRSSGSARLRRLSQDFPRRWVRAQPDAVAGCRALSGFLLDTNIISMLAPARAEASARFVEWF